MDIYLISNNLVLNDLYYETIMSIDDKRKNRPLSIEGEIKAQEISSKINFDEIYASSYASALATAKYFIKESNGSININNDLNDVAIGKRERHNIKMLRFMQDKNFDYKYLDGESLHDAERRIVNFLNKVINTSSGEKIGIFTHKRAIMAGLLNYCEVGYNLDERLILSYKDKVLIDDTENDIDIIKLTIDNKKVIDIDYIEI